MTEKGLCVACRKQCNGIVHKTNECLRTYQKQKKCKKFFTGSKPETYKIFNPRRDKFGGIKKRRCKPGSLCLESSFNAR
jgi:hypothetical protein